MTLDSLITELEQYREKNGGDIEICCGSTESARFLEPLDIKIERLDVLRGLVPPDKNRFLIIRD